MANYSYVAISDTGKQFKGSMNANNVSDLEYKLNEIGLELLTSKVAGSSRFSLSLSSKIKTKDLKF